MKAKAPAPPSSESSESEGGSEWIGTIRCKYCRSSLSKLFSWSSNRCLDIVKIVDNVRPENAYGNLYNNIIYSIIEFLV